jgi:kynurenine formamidase
VRQIPKFDELAQDDRGLPVARGVWGADDELGTLNNITADAVCGAAALITRGCRFNLNLPLDFPLGVLGNAAHRRRRAPKQVLLKDDHSGLLIRDEKLDDFYTQGSTQWDGLTHVGDPVYGFYNGVTDAEVTQQEGTKNGIEHYVDFGLVSRGVLLDLPRFYAAVGRQWSAVSKQLVEPADLEECLRWARVELKPGDILVVRTGWLEMFLEADTRGRDELFSSRSHSGLSGEVPMWKFLWDNRVAAIGADNVSVETLPFQHSRPSLHLAIARLGLVLGELFNLEALAADCAETATYTFFFASVPLNLRGDVGSPANAIAIR